MGNPRKGRSTIRVELPKVYIEFLDRKLEEMRTSSAARAVQKEPTRDLIIEGLIGMWIALDEGENIQQEPQIIENK